MIRDTVTGYTWRHHTPAIVRPDGEFPGVGAELSLLILTKVVPIPDYRGEIYQGIL